VIGKDKVKNEYIKGNLKVTPIGNRILQNILIWLRMFKEWRNRNSNNDKGNDGGKRKVEKEIVWCDTDGYKNSWCVWRKCCGDWVKWKMRARMANFI